MRISILTLLGTVLIGLALTFGSVFLVDTDHRLQFAINGPMFVGIPMMVWAGISSQLSKDQLLLKAFVFDLGVASIYGTLLVITLVWPNPALIPIWVAGIVMGVPPLFGMAFNLHSKANGGEGISAEEICIAASGFSST